jgi:hypothetical protein
MVTGTDCIGHCKSNYHTIMTMTTSFIFCSNMTSFKRFESKPVVKIILIYDRLNLWRHRQFITIFYQFLHIRIEIIHGSHMYILFLPRIGLYVSFLPLPSIKPNGLLYDHFVIQSQKINITIVSERMWQSYNVSTSLDPPG